MHLCNRITLLCTWNTVSQLYSNKIYILKSTTTEKISTQKSVAYPKNNELSKKEIKKAMPFTITSISIKYFEIRLTNEIKDWYAENYKKNRDSWKKNLETHKWNKHLMLILLRWQYYPKQCTHSIQPLLKSSQCSFFFFFYRNRKSIPKFIWNGKGPWIAK